MKWPAVKEARKVMKETTPKSEVYGYKFGFFKAFNWLKSLFDESKLSEVGEEKKDYIDNWDDMMTTAAGTPLLPKEELTLVLAKEMLAEYKYEIDKLKQVRDHMLIQYKENIAESQELRNQVSSLKQHNLKLTECLGGIVRKFEATEYLENLHIFNEIKTAKSLIK